MFLTSTDQFEVRLALDDTEILAAQRLRYKVFIEEFGASLPKNDKNERLERDKFDQYCDHLILIDKCSKNYSDGPPVVGTIRLMESDFVGPVNIGSDEMISIRDFTKMVMDISGKDLSIKYIDGPTGVKGRNSDNELIEKMLSWKPSLPLRDGMVKAYAWITQEIEKKNVN